MLQVLTKLLKIRMRGDLLLKLCWLVYFEPSLCRHGCGFTHRLVEPIPGVQAEGGHVVLNPFIPRSQVDRPFHGAGQFAIVLL